ncbi:MAG: leucine-rich repeat protein, partial [Prevotella sp.]
IDGYKSDGNYFHVNWGWGGACNGYFNLFALDHENSESEPTEAGWHYDMTALIGLSPEVISTAKLSVDESGSYLITSADDWKELSENLSEYSGGSFKLTNDISVSTMVGSEEVPFSGTFDGQGHTLNVNIESDNEYTAPFHWATNSTFKNLTIAGTITVTNHFAGGLIGWAENVTLQGCESKVTINSQYSGDGTHGGFISIVRGGYARFYDCVFSGIIDGSETNHCGGFCGWRDGSRPEFYNCLNIGSLNLEYPYDSYAFSRNGATCVNSFYISSLGEQTDDPQGISVSASVLESGSLTQTLQGGSRDWTTGQVWGQTLGSDTRPVLTDDTNKGVYTVTFTIGGQVIKRFISNSPIGDKMPSGEDFGLTNATFTYNGAAFDGTTTFSSDPTIVVSGTTAYTMTLGSPENGSISINNNTCLPGTLKKVTTIPADGYVVSAVKVTDANDNPLPVTKVSNAENEYVFTFPMSSVKVTAEFAAGEAEAVRFINGGMTLPSSWRNSNIHWTADTWMIWGDEYDGTDNVIVGAPPVDAMGHLWYDEGYELTNSDEDVLPNGNKIVWENHAASFKDGGNYDYFHETGAPWGDRLGDFYIRRIFTFNTKNVPTKLYLSCSYDDSPAEYYINGTLVYEDHKTESLHDDCYEVELTPAQIALIHTDGTPNVMAVHTSQNWGGYHLDCGLYDASSISYEVTGENTVRVARNAFTAGDITIPETVTYNGKTYTVTELAGSMFEDCGDLTSVVLPSTITSVDGNAFRNCQNLQYVKSYVDIYNDKTLIAAPVSATEFELAMGYGSVYRNAFKFTENLTKLTLPRSLTEIGEKAFSGCKALTEMYVYSKTAPSTASNAFEGISKSTITVHVYESALNSFKESWGEEFTYVTMPDPQQVSLTVNVEEWGTLRSLIDEKAAEQNSTIYDVVGITVTGNVSDDDLWVLSEMCKELYSLSTIDFGEANVQENRIYSGLFYDRDKLTSIVLPETLERIEDDAFNNCDGLTSIDIPASVTYIGHYAFRSCRNLTTVTGMEGLSDSGSYGAWDVFMETAITEPVYGGSVFLYLPPSMTGSYEVPAGIKMTTAGSMRNSQLSSITLPGSLTDLGDDTFMDCPNLTEIYCYAPVPPTCHSGVWEFGFDKEACTVYVPESSVEAYQNAEEWRDMGHIIGFAVGELVDMTIDVATAGTLDDELFDAAVAEAGISDKTLIRNLTVTGSLNADDVAYLNALPNTLYYMEKLDLGGTALDGNAITDRMFYATSYKNIVLPSTVTSIGSEAFRNSRRLSSITLPESLLTIGSYAFAQTGLTSIEIPDAVTTMGHRGLQECSALTTIKIGNGVTEIPECWAEYCDNLQEVTIGKKVTSIKWRALRGSNIQNVYSYAKMPPAWNGIDEWDWSFYDGINSEAVLHVYSNCVSRYENAGGWNNFPTIVGDLGTYPSFEMTVNVETMGTFSDALTEAMTAAGCEDMMDITKLTVTGNINNNDLYYIRNNMGRTLDALDLGEVKLEEYNWMASDALNGCAFETLILPNTVEYMDNWYTLENCDNLKTIHIPSSVKKIGPAFLYGCNSLETVTGGEGIIDMDRGNGMYFDNCPNLQSPVILNTFFFRLPLSHEGEYEVPDYVTEIARDGMWKVTGLTALTLPESVIAIHGNAFASDENLKDIYYYAVEIPETHGEAFNDFDKPSCTLHVYEEMVDVFKAEESWCDFNIVGDLGSMPVRTPMNEADYADLCAIYNTLGGDAWKTKWVINKNVQTASRWRGVSFDEEGYVTEINLRENGLSGDITSLTFTGLSRLNSFDLSYNSITGDVMPMKETLPGRCNLNVLGQDFGYIGEHTLYELCNYGELPSIAYYNDNSGSLVSTLIGVDGVCKFAHEGTNGGHYWDCYIYADGGTSNNFKFYWPSPAIVECAWPHRFTFTYNYNMGDANMDDAVNVLDLQSTLNYSNNQGYDLFNFYAADTYGPDDDINVQDIVATVNILLAQESTQQAAARAFGDAIAVEKEACISVEDGQIVLYTTKPVAALDLHIAGIEPQHLTWNTENMGFATATAAQQNGTHAIIYSLMPREIEAGRTVIATYNAEAAPRIASSVLSDSNARTISVGNVVPTGIGKLNGNAAANWSITNVAGTTLMSGTNATEADILKKAKGQQLNGVFIINMDGEKRKIVIK